MSDNTQRIRFAARLRAASEDGMLGAAQQRQASELARRLECGVTIAVLGPHGSGKSSLLEVFLGRVLPPESAGHAVRLFHGPGQNEDRLGDTAPDEFAAFEIDAPPFDTVRILDIAGDEKIDSHVTRHQWAIAHADIVLWCAQDFTAADQQIWAQAPDPLKDNSFLVMTRADACAARGSLKQQVLNLQAVAADEFHSVFPTTAVQALRALQKGDKLSDSVFASSGVKALATAVTKLARSGLQADLDAALLFMEKHGPARPFPQASVSRETPSVAGLYESALDTLRARGRVMAGQCETDPEEFALSVLQHCEEMAEELLEAAELVQDGSDTLATWRNDLMDASDRIVLMGLEGGLPPALDAMTVMVQLARGAEARINI